MSSCGGTGYLVPGNRGSLHEEFLNSYYLRSIGTIIIDATFSVLPTRSYWKGAGMGPSGLNINNPIKYIFEYLKQIIFLFYQLMSNNMIKHIQIKHI